MFDLSIPKLLILAVIALIIFGPHELPKIASQAGKALRDLRRIADSAKNDLREGLGPEFRDFDFDDLNPKSFVRKHLVDDLEAAISAPSAAPGQAGGLATQTTTSLLAPGETPPYDVEATLFPGGYKPTPPDPRPATLLAVVSPGREALRASAAR